MVSSLRRRDLKVLSLIGSGHALSHFYILALPPLFPLLLMEFEASYAALGLIITAINIVTGLFQIPAGMLADRIGARAVLVAGLMSMGGTVASIGLASSYEMVIVLALVFGIGNSAIHPADYAILSSSIATEFIGRAFAIHTFTGNVGFALAPVTIVLMAALLGWRAALVAAGGLAIVVVVLVVASGGALGSRARTAVSEARPAARDDGLRIFRSAPILVMFLFFVFTGLVGTGIQTFLASALVGYQDMSLAGANTVLTAYLVASASGILVGGVIADRTRRHGLVASAALAVSALIVALAGTIPVPAAALLALFGVAGILQGGVRPARDMMVRAVAPQHATGRVFAFVSTGLNVGGAIAPALFGLIIDLGRPQWVFLVMAAMLALTIVVVGVSHLPLMAARVRRTPSGAEAD
ncbi:MAG: MFS transporter [Pseudomonadota bacterium]